MELAKPALDVGLYTNQLDAMLAFWQEQAQVPFSEMLPLGAGVRQHRHAIGDSVLKINHSRTPIDPGAPTGLRRLSVYSGAVDSEVALLDPDGNEVTLLPSRDGRNLRLHMSVNDLTRHREFYGSVLGLPAADDNVFRVGASEIEFEPGEVGSFERSGIGLRYMTMQVYDVVGTHQQILADGGREGMAPVRLGEVAYISFVLDPDGNWIEISQRKSITGSLA